MRQALGPRPGHPELGRAVDRVQAFNRVQVDARRRGAEQLVGQRRRRPGLDPDLVDGLAPEREHTDAVAARGDGVEVLEQRLPAQPLEHPLADLERRLDVEHHPRHGGDRAESDDDPIEVRVAPPNAHQLTVGRDELERCDRRRKTSVAVARAVRRGGHRTGDRDVGQGRQVGQRQPVADAAPRRARRSGSRRRLPPTTHRDRRPRPAPAPRG